MAIMKTILLHRFWFISRKIEGAEEQKWIKKKEETQTDVSRSVIGRSAYANATSESTGMR